MDFVVSRVVMSICALLVASVLAGVVDVPQFEEPDRELRDIAEALCRTAEDCAGSFSEVDLVWVVPSLASGGTVQITIDCELVTACSADSKVVAGSDCEMHLWEWDGTSLNRSRLEALDASSAPILARSGDSIVLESIAVEFEGLRLPILFVSVSG